MRVGQKILPVGVLIENVCFDPIRIIDLLPACNSDLFVSLLKNLARGRVLERDAQDPNTLPAKDKESGEK